MNPEVLVNVATILDMAADGLGDRVAIGGADGVTYARLRDLARRGSTLFDEGDVVLYVGQSGPAFAVAFFASAWAGATFVPLNYRLGNDQLQSLVGRHGTSTIIADSRYVPALPSGRAALTAEEWLRKVAAVDLTSPEEPRESDVPAMYLYTSGTSSAPKAAILKHDNLAAYVFGTVDYAGAPAEDAALVSVPPYHIAGVANLLSNVFAGRRIVYLPDFTPQTWLDTVRAEGITQAMVVPTMLARVVEAVDAGASAAVPTLRSISYGGARMHESVLRRALDAFGEVGFVNAYGLTETSSSIAVLGPDDHRAALTSEDEAVRRRLASVGKLLPGVEVEVRDVAGDVLPAGEPGDIWVRGEQVSGEYAGIGSVNDANGWFPTKDAGFVDDEGYLFVEGRTDDTIIRGGENIAPAEVEDVLLRHPAVLDVAVVGVPDEEWGQRVAAVVVRREGVTVDADELTAWTRQHLRGSRAAEVVVFREELPRTDTGKLLRRRVQSDLAPA